MEGQPEQLRQRYKQLVLTIMRRWLIEEEWDELGPAVTGSLEIVAGDVRLKTYEGEGDVIVVLFRKEEARGFGPLYGFRMQVEEDPDIYAWLLDEPEHILDGEAEGWADIILANLRENVNSRLRLGKRDPERGVTWVM